MLVAVVLAIALQLGLSNRLSLQPRWLLPSLEAVLLVGLTIANPVRQNRESTLIRMGSLALVAAMSLANSDSAIRLIHQLLVGTAGDKAGPLLAGGAEIYLTNIIAFGLWYWEFDRGGPAARTAARRPFPDFLFPQMANPDLAAPDWTPTIVDYLYISFTNATAFSPTDTMPLSRWSKVAMLAQSAVALATSALVIARVVNIFH